MLHILLFILKIIGWIFLVILGFLVLLLCAVLFLPASYQAEVSAEKDFSTLKADASFHSFFYLFSAKLLIQEGKTDWKIRIAWKSLHSGGEEEASVKDGSDKKDISPDTEDAKAEKKDDGKEAGNDRKERPAEEKLTAGTGAGSEEKRKEEHHGEARQDKKRKTAQAKPGIFQKIKYTFAGICDKIKKITEKKNAWQEFITDETHQRAFSRVCQEVKKLLRRSRPRNAEGKLRFGSADPALTGKILGGISMVRPLLNFPISISPDFEQKIFEGELSVRGRIQFAALAAFIWNILWDKDVRTVYAHYKKMKGE